MTPGYKVTSSLIFDDSSGGIDFKGCLAKITGETQSYLEVVFYEGDAFMISKNEFISATEPIEYFHRNKNMHTADITLWLGDKQIKRFRTLLLPNDQNYTHVKKNVLMWFKLSEGTHYDNITTELVNEVSKFNVKTEMPPKTKTIKTNDIEDAVVVEETNDVTSLAVTDKWIGQLPEKIEGPFFIAQKDGSQNEHSLAEVKRLDEEAAQLLEKATPETYGSVAIWNEVSALKIKARDQRTKLDKERLRLKKPWDDFFGRLKSATDKIGDEAKKVEDKLAAALQKKEDHEAEELRKKEEAKRIRTEERRESLRALDGVYDVNTSSVSFDFLPGVIVNQMQMMEYDDREWKNQYDIIFKAHGAEQLRIATAKEKEENEKAEALRKLDEADERITNYRLKELKLEGFVFDEALQAFVKNGVTLHMQAVKGYTDDQWDESINQANNPVPAEAPAVPVTPSSPASPIQPPSPPIQSPVGPPSAGFDALGSVIGAKVAAHNERVEELDGVVRKEFVFTKDQPYIDVFFKNSTLRVAPFEYSEEALHGVLGDKIVGNVNNDELGVKFLAIKK